MKPSRPWLMPTSGRFQRASSRAMPSMVPSPPTTTARSQRWPISAGRQGLEVGDAGGRRSVAFERDLQALFDQEIGDVLQQRADAARLILANDGSMTKAQGHANHYTIGQPARHPRAAPATYNPTHAGRTRPYAAEDPGGAVHRRRHAGGIAHAVAHIRAGPLAGHHPQRDGRPGGPGPDRQPAHQRRPRAHGAWLPALRGHHAHRAPPGCAARWTWSTCRPRWPPHANNCTPTSRSA
jgi:hypothetical protein